MKPQTFAYLASRLLGVYFIVLSIVSFASAFGVLFRPAIQLFSQPPRTSFPTVWWWDYVTYLSAPAVQACAGMYLYVRAAHVAGRLLPSGTAPETPPQQ